MTEDQWADYVKKSQGWAIRMGHDLLHSKAYRKLTYGPAIKLFNWFHEKVKIEVNKKKRGKQRYKVIKGDMKFEYTEAGFRGLSHQQFRKALSILHSLGFIDVRKPGSSLKGDYSVFTLSNRWREYETTDFVTVEFPRSPHYVNFGFGAEKKRLKDKKVAQEKS